MRARFRQPDAVHLIRHWQGHSSISTYPFDATLSRRSAVASRGAVSAQDDLLGLRARIVCVIAEGEIDLAARSWKGKRFEKV